jgi:superfamily I DNA and/or RNA helicase
MGEMSILKLYDDKGHGFSWLAENYRNHPDMLEFPNRLWYAGRLRSNACVKIDTPGHRSFRNVFMKRYNTDVAKKYYFIKTMRGVAHVQSGGTSLENYSDAKVAFEVCKEMIANGIEERKITIIPSFSGQRLPQSHGRYGRPHPYGIPVSEFRQ